MAVKDYVSIARPDHWVKNVFVVLGVVICAMLTDTPFRKYYLDLAIGLASVCFAASSNYVLNEWLDAESDQHHPFKNRRPAAQGMLKPKFVYLEYVLLVSVALTLGILVSPYFILGLISFLSAGVIYNVKPLRTKDRTYLDVISESINNPIRLVLGWAVVHNSFPPSSLILIFWMTGAFLMSVKRLSEYRLLIHKSGLESAVLYRNAFRFYTENGLLLSSFFYAINSCFFLGIFLIKYRIEYVLTFPFFGVLFTWYLLDGLKEESVSRNPELLPTEPKFLIFLVFLTTVIVFLTFVNIPILNRLLQKVVG